MPDMQTILDTKLKNDQAGLWFLGQSGFCLKAGEVTIAIDPYLSDSVGKTSPKLTRCYPPPILPEALDVDIMVITHDHLDHLDPETLGPYRHKEKTLFIGPRFVCKKLAEFGIPAANIIKIDQGETAEVKGIAFQGVYTVPNEPDVIDTCGYRVAFPNGRSVYHTSDTGMSQLLLQAVPQAEVGLFCINGMWGNLTVEEAAQVAVKVRPRFAIGHHYDLMELNSQNPRSFEYVLGYTEPSIEVKILQVMEPFTWGNDG